MASSSKSAVSAATSFDTVSERNFSVTNDCQALVCAAKSASIACSAIFCLAMAFILVSKSSRTSLTQLESPAEWSDSIMVDSCVRNARCVVESRFVHWLEKLSSK